jgi:hypothetical protein
LWEVFTADDGRRISGHPGDPRSALLQWSGTHLTGCSHCRMAARCGTPAASCTTAVYQAQVTEHVPACSAARNRRRS